MARSKARRLAATFDAAWATISYELHAGYRILALHESEDDATEAALQGTRQRLDDLCYAGEGRHYAAVFASPVQKFSAAPSYRRGSPYFAALRAARGGCTPARAVFLFSSSEEVVAACRMSEELGAEKILTKLGGPVCLPAVAR
jgi:hypothetical protein